MSNLAEAILFTSCKGGVGKSSVCANLGMSLALTGKRVLLVDCDFGNRCLDIVTGLSDSVLYDISDVVCGRIPFSRAVIRDSRSPNLYFLAAPFSFDNGMRQGAFRNVMKGIIESGEYDFVFFDTPGGVGEPLYFASSVADAAYIIVSPSKASVRAADRTADFLYSRGITRQRLIVNKVTGGSVSRAKDEITSIIDGTSVRLIGAVPYEPEIIRAANDGKLVDELYSVSVTRAFDNIAQRTMGEFRPLFYKIHKLKRIK